MKDMKAIIIGASSGIGREIAIQLSQKGFEIGLVARRKDLLLELQQILPETSHVMSFDITDFKNARKRLSALIKKMKVVDYIIINAGIGIPNPNWEDEQRIICTNVQGFAAMANFSYEYFKSIGRGNISGVSSIAGIRGGRMATAYCASKAFMSNYMEGLRCRAKKEGLNIKVTDIVPGFVDTSMTRKLDYKFWVASSEKAAKQAIASILKNKRKAYVTKKWLFIALLMKIIPFSIYSKL